MRYCLFYIFTLFSDGRGSHFGWSICEKSDINLKQLHLQIILTQQTKFYSAFHEILALKQNKAGKQEVGNCDLILLLIFFFILIISKIKVQLMRYIKFQLNTCI